MTLSVAQRRFLALHARYLVTSHRWYFQESQLRASSDRHNATIWRDELLDLMGFGFIECGHGYADVRITDAGRTALEASQQKEMT